MDERKIFEKYMDALARVLEDRDDLTKDVIIDILFKYAKKVAPSSLTSMKITIEED